MRYFYVVRQFGKDNEDANMADHLTEQITRLISAQTETSATRGVPGAPKVPSAEVLDELTDDTRFQQHDTGETA